MTTTPASSPRTTGERSNRLLLILAVVAAAVAGILVFTALRSSNKDETSSSGDASTVQVVVASHDLNPDARLSGDDLEVRTVSQSDAVRGAYSDKSAAIGKTLRYPVLKGEQVSTTKVGETISEPKNQPIGVIIDTDMVGIGVKATVVTNGAGNVTAGDHVNVIAVFDQHDNTPARAETILQNVLVLSVDQDKLDGLAAGATPEPTAERGRRPSDQEPKPTAKAVLLEVTPEQAQVLALVDTNATIYLAPRASGDGNATPAALGPSVLVPPGNIATAQVPQP